MSEFKNDVENTTKTAKENPMEFLAEAMAFRVLTGSPSNAIYAQEARGQAQLVKSEVLPTKINNWDEYDAEAYMKELGFELGDEVEGDEIFRHAKLPPGWTKQPTDHSMWSEILDEQGRKRFGVFYKAAFYDRSAHLSPTRRFEPSPYHEEHCLDPVPQEGDAYEKREQPGQLRRAVVLDSGRVIASTEWYDVAICGDRPFDLTRWLDNAVKRWLNEHYPEWQDSRKYWDVEVPVDETPVALFEEDKKR